MKVGFSKFAFHIVPRVWFFDLFAGIFFVVPIFVLNRMIISFSGLDEPVLTSDNFAEMFGGWKTAVILVSLALILFIFFVVEVPAKILFGKKLIAGEKTSFLREVHNGIKTMPSFATPIGILGVLVVIVFGFFPLFGSIFKTFFVDKLQLTEYMVEKFHNRHIWLLMFFLVLAFLVFLAIRYSFFFQGVVLDGMKPRAAAKNSVKLIRENGFLFFVVIVRSLIWLGIVELIICFLVSGLPHIILQHMEDSLPVGYVVSKEHLLNFSEMTENDVRVTLYRIVCCIVILFGNYVVSVSLFMGMTLFIIRLTGLYRDLMTGDKGVTVTKENWGKNIGMKFLLVFVTLFIFLGSAILGILYNFIFESDRTLIVAHRGGGFHASENSLDGIEYAIEAGCYASEIDVQRTKDGVFVISHDKTLTRLTGKEGKISDMNWDDIKFWLIPDTTGNGQVHTVLKLEDVLDYTDGRETLFIELKGSMANKETADELMEDIRERDCVDRIVFISFNLDVIQYIENTYPEFRTGALIKDPALDYNTVTGDILLFRHDIIYLSDIRRIKEQGRQLGVWTVNSKLEMNRFLMYGVDYLITDEVDLVEEVRMKIDERSEREHIIDAIRWGIGAKGRWRE